MSETIGINLKSSQIEDLEEIVGFKRYDNQSDPPGLTPTGDPAVWELSVPFKDNALVFVRGLLMTPAGEYSVVGNQITYVTTPNSDDVLVVVQ